MFGLGHLSRAQRLVLGIFILLLVDVIWVASIEVTEYLRNQKNYQKPYFSTYMRSCMFMLYLTGFLIWRSWRLQCKKNNGQLDECHSPLDEKIDTEKLISDPVFVPIKFEDKNGGIESHNSTNFGNSRSVRFNNLSEVRQLSDIHAEEAVLARLSYAAYVRAEEIRIRVANKLSVKQVAKMAAILCLIFFFGNLSYQEALKEPRIGVVHVLSSTSGIFTLVLAAIFPSSNGDRLTLSKFVAVLISIGGIVLVSLSGDNQELGKHTHKIPWGALWALFGAMLYAIYLVLVRRRVDNEEKLNMPMFFGFVGFFTLLFLWPGLIIVHFTAFEEFIWPDKMEWIFLVINGLIGTVLSELLWLWGCFLTSSLVATLSVSLTIPMTMIADIIVNKNVNYNWMFYAGVGPVFIAFFAVTILSHYDNWDPAHLAIKKFIQCMFRRRLIPRLRELDREQTENLISFNGDRNDR